MKYVAGIDGGQSGTKAAIGDERGRVVGCGEAGPADEIGVDAKSTRLRDALASALDAARRDAQLGGDVSFEAVVAGISGYEGRVYGVAPALPTRNLELMHDAPIAHAGAFGGGPGVVTIAGTGSMAYGVSADGRTRIAGGWGFLFGDEGSGFWIAREALARAMRGEDGATEESALSFFDVPDLRSLARRFYMGDISRDRIAAFATVVLEESEMARGQAADALATLAMHAVSEPSDENVTFAFVGGVWSNGQLRELTAAALQGKLEARRIAAEIVEPHYPPVLGALLLAYRNAGIEVPSALRLREATHRYAQGDT